MRRHRTTTTLNAIRGAIVVAAAGLLAALVDTVTGGPTWVTWLAISGAGVLAMGAAMLVFVAHREKRPLEVKRHRSKRSLAQFLLLVTATVALARTGVSTSVFWALVGPLLAFVVVWEFVAQVQERRRATDFDSGRE